MSRRPLGEIIAELAAEPLDDILAALGKQRGVKAVKAAAKKLPAVKRGAERRNAPNDAYLVWSEVEARMLLSPNRDVSHICRQLLKEGGVKWREEGRDRVIGKQLRTLYHRADAQVRKDPDLERALRTRAAFLAGKGGVGPLVTGWKLRK